MKSLIPTLLITLILSQLTIQSQDLTKSENEWIDIKVENQKSATLLVEDKIFLNLKQFDKLSPLTPPETDAIGMKHYRYQQSYKGIPIEGAIYLLHEKNNKVEKANGKLVHNLNMDIIPSMAEDTALKAARKHTNAKLFAWEDATYEDLKKQVEASVEATFEPTGELVIIDPDFGNEAEKYKLAYKFDIYALKPLSRNLVYVDAEDGSIITTIEKIHDCNGDPDSWITVVGNTDYSGDVLFYTDCGDNGEYTLKCSKYYENGSDININIQVFDAENTFGYPQIPITDTDGNFDEDPTANEVYWATGKTYDYFFTKHGRYSLDNNGMPLYSWVHYGTDLNNAFWNGSWMTYGDGDNSFFSSLTSPDVVGHEMVHGITEFSAGLIYSYESGALNESFSDIFGEVAEWYMRGNTDWRMGGDFTVETGKNCLRDLSNPNSTTAKTPQPDTYLGNLWRSDSGDNGGVHYNSGVQNYWFYLLSEGGTGVNDNGYTYNLNGIGIAKAAEIAYRNLTVYLTPTSQYADAREGAIQAAIDLYGPTSNEFLQTEAAWCAVGVGNCNTSVVCNRQGDSLALVSLFNSTDGANWTNTWDLNQPIDIWYGVALNESGCVVGLDLSNNQLNGNLPAEIGDLSNLDYLLLISNQLYSCYHSNLYNLCDSYDFNEPTLWDIDSGNNFDAPFWDFCYNGDGTCLPPSLCRQLDSLALVALYNATNGANWTNTWDLNQPMDTWHGVTLNADGCVTELVLTNNGLSGSLPPEIGNLNQLTKLWLGNNNLTGNIPPEIGNLNNLGNLILGGNQLSGGIPPELGNLNNLWYVDISFNQLSGCYHANLSNLCSFPDLPNWSIEPGNNFEATFIDFCINGDATCPVVPIWPGDFNNDGIANNADLLQWGIAEGTTGASRQNDNTDWSAKDCPEWNEYINYVNVKHSDGNGNGTVEITDIQALIENYNKTHTVVPNTFLGSPFEFKFYEGGSSPSANSTITTVYNLKVESMIGSPVNLHGLAGSISLNGFPNIHNVNFDFSNSVLQPSQHMDTLFTSQNTIDFALTRTDKTNVLCDDETLARLIIVTADVPVVGPYSLSAVNGVTMSGNGEIIDVAGSAYYSFLTQYFGIVEDFTFSLSTSNYQCSNPGEATAMPTGGNPPYTFSWSNGETTAQVDDLNVGTHSVVVSDDSGASNTIDFNIQWAFTPVEVTANNTQIHINFSEEPLSEPVQVSIDNGQSYEVPITSSQSYSTTNGTHHVWIKRESDQCPVDLGLINVSGSVCRTPSNIQANKVELNNTFSQFVTSNLEHNYLIAEKTYICHQKEIHQILNSNDPKYEQIQNDFSKMGKLAVGIMLQSFVSEKTVEVNEEHLTAIHNFLLSLSKASINKQLKADISQLSQYVNVMDGKEVKDALVAFDRAGVKDAIPVQEIQQTTNEVVFKAQLLNTFDKEAMLYYTLPKQGTLTLKVYNAKGEQLMKLKGGSSQGKHLVPINKASLPKGVYFVYLNYISKSDTTITKILKLPVM